MLEPFSRDNFCKVTKGLVASSGNKSGDPSVWSSYRRCRNKVTAMTGSAKRQYISNLVSDFKHNSSKFLEAF